MGFRLLDCLLSTIGMGFIKLAVENKSSTRKKLCNILYETFRLFYNILHENNLIEI